MSEMQPPADGSNEADRRTFLSSAAMGTGLLAGYGYLAYMAGSFLYLNQPRKVAWIFVAEAARLKLNETLLFQTPAGQQVTITRQKETGAADDFLALSTTCPHLGCKVHWEAQHNRFFCPCHNGVFDAAGKGTEGPPAGLQLPQFPLKLENGLIFIEAPTEALG